MTIKQIRDLRIWGSVFHALSSAARRSFVTSSDSAAGLFSRTTKLPTFLTKDINAKDALGKIYKNHSGGQGHAHVREQGVDMVHVKKIAFLLVR